MLTKQLSIIGLSGVVVLFAAWLYLRPAFLTEASIRASLLRQAPLGSSIEQVRALAEKRGWVNPGAKVASYMSFKTGTGVDVTAISGTVQRDPFPYRTIRTATWEFDLSNRLVNISVLRGE